jgi:microcin C transport system substrate-binding protein
MLPFHSRLALGVLGLALLAGPAGAEEATPVAATTPATETRHYAQSLVGRPAMPPDYKAFPWVNPDAPKGGVLRESATGTFDNLNPFTVNGDPAEGLGLISDTLMASSPDEPATQYGLIAEYATVPADNSAVTFHLRQEARFNDGTPVTPEDVVYSLEAQKKADPQHRLYYKNVVKAEQTGPQDVTFSFDVTNNRELPVIVGEMIVLPKHYWEGKGANGETRDISKTTLEPPIGSGPYRIKSLEPGRTIVYERVKDYWAKDLPVSKGQWNFDELRFEYFRDRVPAFEAFKAGNIDYWSEISSLAWAQKYTFDAVKKGLVQKINFPHKRVAGMQGFAFNLRRKQFSDPRVRQAFNLAFDFETANKTLFYGQYTRSASYFDNSDLKATGLPQGRELEILNEVKQTLGDKALPAEVFTTEYKNPVDNTPEDLRAHLKEAFGLLQAAGYTQKGGVLVDASGQPLAAEFLLVQPDFERIVLPYIENLKRLGVQASVRTIDSSQYQRRMKTFDFDIIVNSIGQSQSPGNEQRFFFSSAAAKQDGSRNLGGIADPAIDAIIDKVVFAKSRDDLVAATHALDRVLLWNFYVVPQWYRASDWVAAWDIFGRPERSPSQMVTASRSWWMDDAKAKAVHTALGR